MFTNDPLDALVVAHARGSQLRAEAAAERQCGISRTRRAIAGSLRRAADRLDAPALAQRPALSPEIQVTGR
jgi:hypothetical protein